MRGHEPFPQDESSAEAESVASPAARVEDVIKAIRPEERRHLSREALIKLAEQRRALFSEPEPGENLLIKAKNVLNNFMTNKLSDTYSDRRQTVLGGLDTPHDFLGGRTMGQWFDHVDWTIQALGIDQAEIDAVIRDESLMYDEYNPGWLSFARDIAFPVHEVLVKGYGYDPRANTQ